MHCTSNTAVFSINEDINCSPKVHADTIGGGDGVRRKIFQRRRRQQPLDKNTPAAA